MVRRRIKCFRVIVNATAAEHVIGTETHPRPHLARSGSPGCPMHHMKI